MSDIPPIPEKFIQHLQQSLLHISHTLHDRLKSLASSRSQGDQYECINAIVYLMSSAASQPHVSRAERLRSFAHWPVVSSTQTPQEMAESGFYYLGDADHVKCFFCDLGLRDWSPEDVPAMEHAKFSPLCFFLKASRGLEWLRQRSSRPPNYPASYLRQDHNELMKLMKYELCSNYAVAACGIGFNDTRVLLCIARKFIRQRGKFSLTELVLEMQADFDREVLGGGGETEATQFSGQFDLAGALRAFQV